MATRKSGKGNPIKQAVDNAKWATTKGNAKYYLKPASKKATVVKTMSKAQSRNSTTQSAIDEALGKKKK
jgi:hypothetical protein